LQAKCNWQQRRETRRKRLLISRFQVRVLVGSLPESPANGGKNTEVPESFRDLCAATVHQPALEYLAQGLVNGVCQAAVQTLLQNGRLQIAEALALAEVLKRELLSFRFKVDPRTAYDSY
jgi:hypothetical protein